MRGLRHTVYYDRKVKKNKFEFEFRLNCKQRLMHSMFTSVDAAQFFV